MVSCEAVGNEVEKERQHYMEKERKIKKNKERKKQKWRKKGMEEERN